jgi:hypothetical protein
LIKRILVVAVIFLATGGFRFDERFWFDEQKSLTPAALQFYVSPSGNDSNSGTSQDAPWQTVTKVNSYSLPSNSTVSFQGGQTFSGSIAVQTNNLTINSYGVGQAIISSGNNATCITAINIAGLTVNNITCTGGGNLTNTTDGIHIETNLTGSQRFAGPTITNSTVSGYGVNCINVVTTGATGTAGFDNVTINGNTAHDCTGNYKSSGLVTSCIEVASAAVQLKIIFTNVTVNNNVAYNCPGTTGGSNATGIGIAIGQTTGLTASHNLVHDCGRNSKTTAGPVGILFYLVDQGIMSFNEVYNISTSQADGNGLDFDGGVTNSVMEYNYVHHNTYAEIMLGDFNALLNDSNVVRFNIVEASNNDSGLHFACSNTSIGCTNEAIYNNTIASNGAPQISGSGGSSVPLSITFANNILYGYGGAPSKFNFNVVSGETIKVTGNDYFGSQFHFTVDGGVTDWTSLAEVQAGGYEKVSGGPVGTASNPQLNNPGDGGNCGGYRSSCPSAYKLQAGSPMASPHGLNLNTLYRYNVGTQDFYGNAVTSEKLPIGAHSAVEGTPGPTNAARSGSSVTISPKKKDGQKRD